MRLGIVVAALLVIVVIRILSYKRGRKKKESFFNFYHFLAGIGVVYFSVGAITSEENTLYFIIFALIFLGVLGSDYYSYKKRQNSEGE